MAFSAVGMVFSDYLNAKYPLDQRSLNPSVQAQFLEWLVGPSLRCLDLGTGNGAMLRRLLDGARTPSLSLAGLDRQPELLEAAAQTMRQILDERGYAVTQTASGLFGQRRDKRVELALVDAALADFRPGAGSFDLITAHAFMDIVPLETGVRCCADWLAPGGVFYATLNYDGDTALFPVYAADEAFEAHLLDCYDASMEQRRVDGAATGGRRSGRRLHAALLAQGFEVLGYGSSDWNITPSSGAYRDSDAVCLYALLDFIRAEGEAAGLAVDALQRWYATRAAQIEAARLGIVVHQLDILAVKPA